MDVEPVDTEGYCSVPNASKLLSSLKKMLLSPLTIGLILMLFNYHSSGTESWKEGFCGGLTLLFPNTGVDCLIHSS